MRTNVMEIGSRKFWETVSKVATMLEKQEWASIIPEIPQSELHYLKNKNRVSADAEERGANDKE